MKIKYLKPYEVTRLSDEALNNYLQDILEEQLNVLTIIDCWTDAYNAVNDEIGRRSMINLETIDNPTGTIH